MNVDPPWSRESAAACNGQEVGIRKQYFSWLTLSALPLVQTTLLGLPPSIALAVMRNLPLPLARPFGGSRWRSKLRGFRRALLCAAALADLAKPCGANVFWRIS